MKQEQKCVLVTLIMLSTGLTIPDTWFSMSGGDEGIPAVKTGTGTITFPPLQSATEKKYCNAESREEVCKICKKWGDSFEQKIPFEVFTQRSPHHEDITRAGWEDMLTDLVKAVYSKSNIPSTVNSYIIDVGVPDMQDYKWLEPLTKFIATKSTCEIHSFEANPQTAELIKKKMRGSDFYRQYVKLYNIGMGNSTMRGSRMFWKNAKEPGRGSFQRIRTDDYEQIPVSIRVIPLDDIYSATDGVFIPILKMGAGRWEFAALNAGIQTLKNTAIVVSDTTPVPLNKDVVSLLSSEGFVVYAITNGSLARIPQNAPWWWTSVVAVKPFLQDVAESHVCFDFTESPWVCESPVAAKVCIFIIYHVFIIIKKSQQKTTTTERTRWL